MIYIHILPLTNIFILRQPGKVDLEMHNVAAKGQKQSNEDQGSGKVIVDSGLKIGRKDQTEHVAPDHQL